MPTLEQFKEKQKTIKEKNNNITFQPKRYAPYLLQEEIINNISQQDLQKLDFVNSDNNKFINDRIVTLYGIKKKLLFYFVELCNSSGGSITGSINVKTLISITDSTHKTIKKIIQDMTKEGLIKRMKGKTGKGGFSMFLLTESVKQAVIEYKSKINIRSIEENNNISNNLNNGNDLIDELPNEWKEINTDSLKNIGFTESQLRQLYNKKLNTPQIIQASIDHFSFGLNYNKDKFNKYTDPLNVLMGVLRNGGRWIEKNYETPQERTLKELLEEKKQRQESKERLITEIINLEFPVWEKNLSEEEKKIIVPEEIYKTKITKGIIATLKIHFKEKILLPRLQEQGVLEFKTCKT